MAEVLHNADIRVKGQINAEKDINLTGDLQWATGELTSGDNNTSACVIARAIVNPLNSNAIFAVESSGGATRFGVTQEYGGWFRDGLRIGYAYDNGVLPTIDYQLDVAGTGRFTGKVKAGADATEADDLVRYAQLGSHAFLNHWYGTQAQYDVITTPDNDTIYYIEEQDVDVTAVAGDITSTDIANWTAVYNWYASGGAVLPTGTTGQLLYHNGTGWTTLAQGTDGHVLTLDSGLPVWAAGGSGGMVYPGAGIALSTGTAWDTSITLGTGYLYYDGTSFSWQSGSSSAESDPIFTQSAAFNISAGQISHWDEVYTWYDSTEHYDYWQFMIDNVYYDRVYNRFLLHFNQGYGIGIQRPSSSPLTLEFSLNIWNASAIQSYFPINNYILSVEEGSNLIRFTKMINAAKSLAGAMDLLDINDIPSHPSAGYLYWTGSKYTWAAGAGGSVWSTDTYGIKYEGGNVGIGGNAYQNYALRVVGDTTLNGKLSVSDNLSIAAGKRLDAGASIYMGTSGYSIFADTNGIVPMYRDNSSVPNDRIYYSNNAGKLVFKDRNGTVHELY